MSEQTSAGNFPLISRGEAGEAISRALHLYVGRGRRYTVKQLANATGVKDRMIEAAMASPDTEEHRPLPFWALLCLTKFLGPVFASEWLAACDQEAAWRATPDLDDLAQGCLDYAGEHTRARHPDSPGGVDIAPEEARHLRVIANRLRAA